MKKCLHMVFVLLLVVLIISTTVIVSFAEGDLRDAGVSWTLDSDGVLTISGEGPMEDYETASASPWYSDRQSIKKVIIADGITHIGARSFYNCDNLSDVEIGKDVVSVGSWAFYNLSSLKDLLIPSSVTTLESSSIRSCTSLGSIGFLGNAPSVGSNVFSDCSSDLIISYHAGSAGWDSEPWTSYTLREEHFIEIESIITEPTCTKPGMATGTCKVCGEIMTEEIPALGHDYVDGICTRCGDIEIIAFGTGWTLYGTGLLDVATMSNYSWEGAPWNIYKDKIITVIIEDGVSFIGDYAFYNCSSLTSITIPDSVTSIGREAFCSCSSLTSITIPDGVTSIGYLAFGECRSLTSITIPEGVTSIGDEEFSNCSSLTSITIPEGVTSIVRSMFWGCSSLTSITLPDSVTNIGNQAFYGCSSLTSITIPDSVTSIGDSAFCGCSSLTSITISDSVTSIGDYAFSNCSSLTRITLPDSVTSIPVGAFSGCSSLTSITIPEGVTSIGDGAFSGCSSLTSITIPDSVTSIGDYALSNCRSLTSITIPDSVTSIAEGTFSNCSSLTSITIPDSVTSIGDRAFSSCTSLESVTIPEGVTSIGSRAFSGCESLTSITIPDGVTSIGGGTFSNCSNLFKLESLTETHVELPYSMYNLEKGTFEKESTSGSGTYLAFDIINYYNAEEFLPNPSHNIFIYGIDGDVIELPKCNDGHIVLLEWNTGGDGNAMHYSPGDVIPFKELPFVVSTDYDNLRPRRVDLHAIWGYSWENYNYTVNYYRDYVSPDNLLGTDSGSAGIGTAIPYVNGKYLPHGYGLAVEIEEKTITRNEAENVLNIVYLPREVSETEICRIAGSNRYATSIEAANHLKEKNGIEKFESIIIASGDDFPDALSASYLAYKKDGPILLVGKNSVGLIADYVNDNLAAGGKVYIVGGTGAVPQALDDRIKAAFGGDAIVRLAGSNRYATNLMVLKEAGVEGEDMLVASGTGFADALSASAAKRPILLVGKTLSADQAKFLSDNAVDLTGSYYIIGGEGAVFPAVENAVMEYGTVKRLAGSNRYSTSIAVAEQFFPYAVDTVVIANGMNFPDGLSGGPIAAAYDAPLILVVDKTYGHAADFFAEKEAFRLIVMGGTGVIADSTAGKITGGTV